MLKISIFLCAWALAVSGSPVNSADDGTYRLTEDVKPSAYELTITPKFPTNDNATKSTFEGAVVIYANVQNAGKKIRIHAKDLKITKENVHVFNISAQNVTTVDVEELNFINKTAFLDIVLKGEVKGAVIINITYEGVMSDDMYGFYLSSYNGADNKKNWVATTQMQPTHARRAFPCFDEPQYKATFKITIIRPAEYKSRSNMKKNTKSTLVDASTVKDEYPPTPVMSTYLVAFIVSKFNEKKGVDKAGNAVDTFSVWARPDAVEGKQVDYASRRGLLLINGMSKYTGIDYFTAMNMKKLDMFALPDFAAGAMENWGLLTYRETALLFDEKMSTARNKQRVASVIAHELAHQWFGDYVTLTWWDNTWLNEGFATYFEYHAVDEDIEKNWEMEEQFVLEEQQTVFGPDALSSSVPLTKPNTNTPDEIQAHFGSISYNKGGSIIRMMKHFLTAAVFKSGLNTYLTANAHDNTIPGDLFTALSKGLAPKQLPAKLETIMKNWIEKPGYPVISISKKSETTLTVTQERFYLAKQKEEDATIWYVPLSVATAKSDFENTEPKLWLMEKTQDVKMETIAQNNSKFIIVNVKSAGYYRVKYDDGLLNQISAVLNDDAKRDDIHKLNRAQLVDDVMNLARAGLMKYSAALKFISYLRKEDNYYPWAAALESFRFLMQRFSEGDPIGKDLRVVLKEMLSGKLYTNETMFEKPKQESQIQTYNRINALQWACNLEEERCVKDATELFKEFVGNKTHNNIPVDARGIVYCTALRASKGEEGEKHWDKLWEKYVESNVAADQLTIMSALGCTTIEKKLKEYLKKSITANSNIRKQDANYVFSAVYTGNSPGVEHALEFLKDNKDGIKEYYGGMNALSKCVTGLADRLTDKKQLEMLNKVLEDESLKDLKQTVQESVKANMDWAESKSDEIKDYLCAVDEKYCGSGVAGDGGGGAAAIVANVFGIVISLTVLFITKF